MYEKYPRWVQFGVIVVSLFVLPVIITLLGKWFGLFGVQVEELPELVRISFAFSLIVLGASAIIAAFYIASKKLRIKIA